MEYRISTIIPVYNCEKFLERAVESVIRQPEFSSVQLILVDDGSNDKSGEICDRYSSVYSNIISIHQKNSGVSAARNMGIEYSKADLISFIDSDDYLIDGFYTDMLKNCDADLVFCDYLFNGENKSGLSDSFENKLVKKDEFDRTIYPAMVDGYKMYQCWNKVFKKSIIEKNALQFPVGVKFAEDMIFVFNYIKYIDSFRFVNIPLYYYFDNSQSVTNSIKNSYDIHEMIYRFLNDYFKNAGFETDIILKNYIYHSIGSMHSCAAKMSFLKSYKNIDRILNKTIFFEKYCEMPIYSHSEGINGYKNKFIMKKNTFLFIILVKYSEIRSKKFIKENYNG